LKNYPIFQLLSSKDSDLVVAETCSLYVKCLCSAFHNSLSWLQTRRDGSLMTLAQSKKLSQMTADNAQWEDRQLLRSGAVRGTEVQTEFDDEDERKVILLVHGMYFTVTTSTYERKVLEAQKYIF
jgi:hypothetical protein